MINEQLDERFDAVILGSGQAGNPLAKDLAKAGWKVAVVESWHIGGTCVNVGCTPSKTMAASARVAYLARRGEDFGVHGGEVTVDLAEVVARKRKIVERANQGNIKSLLAADVTIVMGKGSFAEEAAEAGLYAIAVNSADGTERRLIAAHIFLNTGERDMVPEITGLQSIPYLDSTSIMELETLPRHLIVLGGGPISMEFSQMFRRFGSQVTVVERGSRLMPHEDEDIAACALQFLREDGIEFFFDTVAEKVSGVAGDLRVTLTSGVELRGSHLLVAVGRQPNVESLHLERAGVAQQKNGYIQVDDRLATSAKNIWALGDVKGGPAFTHVSYDDYRIVAANVLHNGTRSVNDRTLVWTTYTDPEIGRVGMSEEEARKSGKKLLLGTIPMSSMARAGEMAETRGLLKAIVDAETELVLGAYVVGVDGGEVVAQIQIAMMGGLKYTALRDGMFSHPTKSEVLNTLFGALKATS